MLSTSFLAIFITITTLVMLSPTTTRAAPMPPKAAPGPAVLQPSDAVQIVSYVLVKDPQQPSTRQGTHGCTLDEIHFLDHAYAEAHWMAEAAWRALHEPGAEQKWAYKTYLDSAPLAQMKAYFGRFRESFRGQVVPIREIRSEHKNVNTVLYQCSSIPYNNAVAVTSTKLTPQDADHIAGSSTYLTPMFFQQLTTTDFQVNVQVEKYQKSQPVKPSPGAILLHERVHCYATLRGIRLRGHVAANSYQADASHPPANTDAECRALLDHVKTGNPSNYGFYAQYKLMEEIHTRTHFALQPYNPTVTPQQRQAIERRIQ